MSRAFSERVKGRGACLCDSEGGEDFCSSFFMINLLNHQYRIAPGLPDKVYKGITN